MIQLMPQSEEKTLRLGRARAWLAVGLIVALGAALRFIGLDWGLPGVWHASSYHPDEFRIAQPVANMLADGVFSSGSHAYGSFFHYQVFFLAKIASLRAALDPVQIIEMARTLSAALGTATILLAYALFRPTGQGAALAASLCCAALPGHVLHSHYGTVDVPATFFVFLSLTFLASGKDGRPSTRALACASVAAGLAAATKYPFGIVLLAVLAGTGLRSWSRAFQVLALGLLTFALVSPFAWINFAEFWRAAFRELIAHQQEGHGALFEGTSPWFHLSVNLPYFLGPAALPLVAFGAVVMLKRRSALDRVLLAYAIPCAVMLSLAMVRFQRYLFPATPWWIAAAVAPLSWPRPSRLARAWLAISVLWMLAIDARMLVALKEQDPRDAASVWFSEHVEEGASVGLVRAPTFEGPGLVRDKPPSEIVTPAVARQRFLQRNEQGGLPYRFVLCSNWRLRTLREEQPELFVLSEFHWRERARMNHDQAENFLRALAKDYELIAEFNNFPPEHRRIFVQTFAPHDWLYPFPAISVYRRR